MMYEEFAEATKCRDNEHNHKVFRELELIYMNSDCTKEHIYEMGRKLVDNRKSEEELKIEAEIQAEMNSHKEQIEVLKRTLEYDQEALNWWKAQGDKDMTEVYRRSVRYGKEQIKFHRTEIAKLKWVLA